MAFKYGLNRFFELEFCLKLEFYCGFVRHSDRYSLNQRLFYFFQEIIVKSVSGILLLLLKHFKINHTYQELIHLNLTFNNIIQNAKKKAWLKNIIIIIIIILFFLYFF